MTLNTTLIGKRYEPVTIRVDRERADRFAEAVGEDRPPFRDSEAARAEGYQEQVAPPTFVTTAEVAGVAQVVFDRDLGLDFSRVVHAQQSYRWERPIHVGDTLTATPCIAEIRTLGSNEILVVEADVTDEQGQLVCVARETILSRGTAGAS
jgi:acyl dehydratase